MSCLRGMPALRWQELTILPSSFCQELNVFCQELNVGFTLSVINFAAGIPVNRFTHPLNQNKYGQKTSFSDKPDERRQAGLGDTMVRKGATGTAAATGSRCGPSAYEHALPYKCVLPD